MSTMRRIAPEKQPLRPAIALAIISLLTVLMALAGVVLAYVLAATGFLEGVTTDQDLDQGQDLVLRIIVGSLLTVAFIAVSLGMQLACLVLGILVVVRGDGKLRIGASMLLATALLGTFFSFSMDGSMVPGTFEDVLVVLGWVAELFRWGVTVAGFVVLWLGIREVRRARAGHPVGPR